MKFHLFCIELGAFGKNLNQEHGQIRSHLSWSIDDWAANLRISLRTRMRLRDTMSRAMCHRVNVYRRMLLESGSM